MFIRKARLEDAAGIANVHISSWKSTYKDIVSDEYLAHLNLNERVERWNRILQDSNHTFVAVNGQGDIVGFANGGKGRAEEYGYDGELYAIYILEEYQRQGIGRLLIHHMAEALQSQGFKNLLVWVLTDNPSRQFYESLSPSKVDEQTITFGGKELQEIAYGWSDISLLIRRLV